MKESVPVASARSLSAWFLRLLAAAVATLLLLAPVTSASADPTPSPGQVEAQINDLWNKSEPLIEEYNKAHSQLTAYQAKASALQVLMQPLQAQVDAAMALVTAIAVRRYKQGLTSSGWNSLLTTGSPTTLADQLSLLEGMAVNQRDQIAQVTSARDRYAADKKVFDDLTAQQARIDADLAGKKKAIDDQLGQLRDLRLKAYGTTTGTGYYRPVACPFTPSAGPGGVAAAAACLQIDKPYIWATAGPISYDCSGLTKYAWGQAGVTLDHYTGTQYDETKRIARADLQTGDLVFYYGDRHHVAIYVGGGWVVQAPSYGDVVRMANIDEAGPTNGFGRPG